MGVRSLPQYTLSGSGFVCLLFICLFVCLWGRGPFPRFPEPFPRFPEPFPRFPKPFPRFLLRFKALAEVDGYVVDALLESFVIEPDSQD